LESQILLRIKNLKTYFPIREGLLRRVTGFVKAVDGVSLEIKRGEILGLVGESGCGKTTLGKSILRLIEPTAGQIWLEDRNIFQFNKHQMRAVKREMQIIFQDPYASLNPRMTVGDIIAEPLIIHKMARADQIKHKVSGLLDKVGLDPHFASRYPHEFSGGQRQRIGIARALSLNPKLIIGDEPVSALDVSIQAQIINLLDDLKAEFGFTYLFIAHDLSVIKHIADRVAVMYLGRIVELAKTESLFGCPLHPYTQALLSAVPVPDPDLDRKRIVLKGDVPSPINPPEGCHFHSRCRHSQSICSEAPPPLREIKREHFSACHFSDKFSFSKSKRKEKL
jgi:oligopeptide transport system ATP-binding protein